MPSAFLDRSAPPSEADLKQVLGEAGVLWDQIKDQIGAEFGPLVEKWSYGGKKNGWSLQLKRKSRTVVHLGPREGHFIAATILGERACKAAQTGGLPQRLLALIDEAPRYPEGRGLIFDVRSKTSISSILKLARVKMAN